MIFKASPFIQARTVLIGQALKLGAYCKLKKFLPPTCPGELPATHQTVQASNWSEVALLSRSL